MTTATQAAQNTEYARRLPGGKQPGSAASAEVTVPFIRRQIEWPEGPDRAARDTARAPKASGVRRG
jgi:hypothetical protein